MALRTPSFRSEVRTRLTLVPLVSLPSITCELGDGIGEVGLGICSPLRKQEGINEDINASPASSIICFKNSRRSNRSSSTQYSGHQRRHYSPLFPMVSGSTTFIKYLTLNARRINLLACYIELLSNLLAQCRWSIMCCPTLRMKWTVRRHQSLSGVIAVLP